MSSSFLWVLVMGGVGAFGFGWGTGANDVANAFATSVGAKTLTMGQAIALACIFEFLGAVTLGRVSTSVIAAGIADIRVFQDHPEIYAYGMMWTLLLGTVWLFIASYHGWNISSTHAIIGGIMGFAYAAEGKDGVLWLSHDPDDKLLPLKGLIPIVVSWFISPLLAGLSSMAIFLTIRKFALYSARPQSRSCFVLPPLVWITTFVNFYFIFTKGARHMLAHPWSHKKAVLFSMVIAFITAIITTALLPVFERWLRRRMQEKRRLERQQLGLDSTTNSIDMTMAGTEERTVELVESKDERREEEEDKEGNAKSERKRWKVLDVVFHGVRVDIHDIVDKDQVVNKIHREAEVFDEGAEAVFGYLQVYSALCVMFAHGAAEVGYMAGPLATLYKVYESGTLPLTVQEPLWVVMFAAISLVAGLSMYGYNVIRAMGTQLTKLTPSRGFAAELATALVVLVSSQWGLPTSSSICITGAIVGVGIAEGRQGVNWRFFLETLLSWVATPFVMAIGAGLLFAQGVYSPHY